MQQMVLVGAITTGAIPLSELYDPVLAEAFIYDRSVNIQAIEQALGINEPLGPGKEEGTLYNTGTVRNCAGAFMARWDAASSQYNLSADDNGDFGLDTGTPGNVSWPWADNLYPCDQETKVAFGLLAAATRQLVVCATGNKSWPWACRFQCSFVTRPCRVQGGTQRNCLTH